MDLTKLTSVELQELKSKWYNDAMKDDTIAKLYKIGRFLGSRMSANYGPKYEFKKDGLRIYVDDYGNYMTVQLNENEVCSTHYCQRKFIPGEWTNEIDVLNEQAESKETEMRSNQENSRKGDLLKQLTIK